MIKKNVANRAVIIEIILFLTYAFFAVNWIAGTTFTPQIMEHFGLTSFSAATFISNAITLAKIIGNLMAATILIKFYPKKAIAFASGLIVLGCILALIVPNYFMFVIARFIMGFGGALYIVYFSPIVLHYFEADKRSLVNGLNAAAYNVGSVIAMLTVTPIFLLTQSWKTSMLVFCLVSLVLLVLWFIFGEDFEINKAAQGSEVKNDYTLKVALKDKFCYIFPFTYSGLLTLYIVLLTIFPISGGASINPKVLSATVAISGIIGSIIGIMASKKFGKRLPIVRWSALAMTLCSFVLVTTSSAALALFMASLVGFFMLFPMSAFMTIPQELPNMTSSKLTLIMGLFWSFSYAIETVLYYIIGITIDCTNFRTGLILAVILSLTLFVGSFLLPETGKKLVKEAK